MVWSVLELTLWQTLAKMCYHSFTHEECEKKYHHMKMLSWDGNMDGDYNINILSGSTLKCVFCLTAPIYLIDCGIMFSFYFRRHATGVDAGENGAVRGFKHASPWIISSDILPISFPLDYE